MPQLNNPSEDPFLDPSLWALDQELQGSYEDLVRTPEEYAQLIDRAYDGIKTGGALFVLGVLDIAIFRGHNEGVGLIMQIGGYCCAGLGVMGTIASASFGVDMVNRRRNQRNEN